MYHAYTQNCRKKLIGDWGRGTVFKAARSGASSRQQDGVHSREGMEETKGGLCALQLSFS